MKQERTCLPKTALCRFMGKRDRGGDLFEVARKKTSCRRKNVNNAKAVAELFRNYLNNSFTFDHFLYKVILPIKIFCLYWNFCYLF